MSSGDTIITKDYGGNVLDYQTKVALSQGEIKVKGVCNSACTMYLAVGNRLCTYKEATWGFHGSTSEVKFMKDYADSLLSESYRNYPEIKHKFDTEWVKLQGWDNYYTESGTEMINMGVRECK
jgi:hypothetical protein